MTNNYSLHSKSALYDGKIYDAKTLLEDILKNAKREIALLDPSLSSSTLDLFSAKSPSVPAYIFTSPSQEFPSTKIKQLSGGRRQLHLFETASFPDCFLIIDECDLYLLSASLSTIGQAPLSIIKLRDEQLIRTFLATL